MKAFDSARDWWGARDRRERTMLTVMAAAIAAFVAWYGVVTPLQALRERARSGHDRSALQLSRVQAMAAALAADRPEAAGTPPSAQMLLDAARAAGIEVSRHGAGPGEGLVIEIDATSAGALFDWLDGLRARHSLAPSALNIAADGGRLRVRAVFGSAP